jgi:hypothetical protein
VFLKNFHLSSNMLWLLHSCVSIVIGALVSGLLYIGQNAFNGSADVKAVALGGVSSLVVYFTSHIGPLFNSPQALQAGGDALDEVKAVVEQHTAAIGRLQALAAPAPVQQPVQMPPPQFAQAAPQFAYSSTSTYPLIPTVQAP